MTEYMNRTVDMQESRNVGGYSALLAYLLHPTLEVLDAKPTKTG